jgi:hypothetical protein
MKHIRTWILLADARLAPPSIWAGVYTHEVFFRDTAHGFLAWGLATVRF